MNARPRDIDEADVDLWLDPPPYSDHGKAIPRGPGESDLRDLVLTLAANHGRLATERRWHEDRLVVRVRSLSEIEPGRPRVQHAWQRHADHDLWADREWPVLPDDILEPEAPAPGDPSSEARCWLHEKPLPECGCPVMGRARAATGYEALTGEPQASSPFKRELAPPVVVERWQSACPSCRAHFVASERPGHLCAECSKPVLCWRPGVDAEPLVAWTPRPADRVWCGPMDQGTEQEGVLKASAPSETSHHGSTVEPWTYTQAGGRARPAAEAAKDCARSGEESRPPSGLGPVAGDSGCESRSPEHPLPASSQRAEGPQEAASPPGLPGAPSLALLDDRARRAEDAAAAQGTTLVFARDREAVTLPASPSVAAGLLDGARAERLRAEAVAVDAAPKAKRHQWQEREDGDVCVCVNGCGKVRKSKSQKVGACVPASTTGTESKEPTP